ncbi:P60-like protein [Lentinula edodes]|uniref:Ribosome biogenesis protein NOP53 n=1 Tax=Lentinula edodes TaxID=5353 RepID=A0A1Q3E3X0_LENED|nr:P60-like protein [Lentinula edodes]
MVSHKLEEDVDKEEKEEETLPPRKIPQRKTKAERRKATKLLVQKRILAERAAKRRQLSYLAELSAKHSRRTGNSPASKELVQQRKKASQEKLKAGILGDELSESLRGIKVEGNLFKDRFLNLQQRALIEPRLRVLPKRRRVRMVEYEKHAWKKFDREQESTSNSRFSDNNMTHNLNSIVAFPSSNHQDRTSTNISPFTASEPEHSTFSSAPSNHPAPAASEIKYR